MVSHGKLVELVLLVETLKLYLGYLRKHNEVYMEVAHSCRSAICPVEENMSHTVITV